MAVTITPSAAPALNTDLILTGSVVVSGALADGTETLNVSIYNSTTGANYNGAAQAYDGTSTVTYTYANGTVVTVNYASGVWTYQRLSTEVGAASYTYVLTFDWVDSAGTQSITGTVATTPNVVINSYNANGLDDLDTTMTGVIDVSIVNISGLTIAVDMNKDGTNMVGTPQTLTSAIGTYTWNYLDGSTMLMDLGSKVFTYTRKASDIGDNTTNSYVSSIKIGSEMAVCGQTSVVGFSPSITTFSKTNAIDTDATLSGNIIVLTSPNTSIHVDVTHSGVTMSGISQLYTSTGTMSWTYTDGSSLVIDSATNTWTYTRVPGDCADLVSDTYSFSMQLTNRYGSDAAVLPVTTAVPGATIVGFSMDNVADATANMSGILKINMPSIATTPTLQIDVSVNGALYTATPALIGAEPISFSYTNGSSLVYDVATEALVYTRTTDDVSTTTSDTYIFDCYVTVNGQVTTQTITAKSYAGIRNYDYQPAYPVIFNAGSTETENTAWPKYIEEVKRIYRLFNENMNYYEAMFQAMTQKIADLEEYIKKLVKGLAANQIGTIIPWTGAIADIPDGWFICDGTHGTPNLTGLTLQGVNSSGKPKKILSAGLPNITATFSAEHQGQGFHQCSGAAYFLWYIPGGDGGDDPYQTTLYGFDASRCSSIYGKSNTVQPPAYTVYWIMKMYEPA